MMAQSVQSRFEIIEDDTVGEAFEDECKFPERINDTDWNHRSH